MAELKEQLTQRVQSHEVILLKVMPLVLATWPSRARCRMRIWHVANTPRGIDAMWGKGMHPRINGTGIDEQTACGFKSATSADIFAQGHALIQNLRNGFSKLIATVPRQVRFMTAWPQLTQAISLASPGSRSYRSHR